LPSVVYEPWALECDPGAEKANRPRSSNGPSPARARASDSRSSSILGASSRTG